MFHLVCRDVPSNEEGAGTPDRRSDQDERKSHKTEGEARRERHGARRHERNYGHDGDEEEGDRPPDPKAVYPRVELLGPFP